MRGRVHSVHLVAIQVTRHGARCLGQRQALQLLPEHGAAALAHTGTGTFADTTSSTIGSCHPQPDRLLAIVYGAADALVLRQLPQGLPAPLLEIDDDVQSRGRVRG